ncbi:Mtn3-like protein, partial [Globisporangium splendens]
MFLSPAPTVYRIHKTKVIGEVSIIPLVSLLANAHSWAVYGLLSGSVFPLFTAAAIGEVAALTFIVVYAIHTTEKAYALKATGCAAAFVAIFTTYAVLGRLGVTNQSRIKVTDWSGYIAVVVSLVLNVSPFETVVKVIKTKSSSSIPIWLSAAGVVSNALWVVYGFIDDDMIVAIPNTCWTAFGVVQVALYVAYSSKKSPPLDTKAVLTPLDNSSEFNIVISPTPPRHKMAALSSLASPLAAITYTSVGTPKPRRDTQYTKERSLRVCMCTSRSAAPALAPLQVNERFARMEPYVAVVFSRQSFLSFESALLESHCEPFKKMLYGLLTDKLFPIFVTFLTGECLVILFMLIYFSVTLDKKYVVRVVACVGAFLFAVTMYAVLGRAGVTQQTSHQAGQTIGFVGVAVSIALDKFLIAVNAVCVAIGVVQILFYVIYMPRRNGSDSRGSWLAEDDRHPKLGTLHTASGSSADFLTPRECISVTMESPEDQLQIVISPRSSL